MFALLLLFALAADAGALSLGFTPSATAVTSVSVGREFSFIIDALDSKVFAMGANSYGQLGFNRTGTQLEKQEVALLPEMPLDIAAGAFHTLFLTESGKVYGAGRDNYGQLGFSKNRTDMAPELIMEDVKAVAAGAYHSLFLKKDGTVEARGSNSAGQLGVGGWVGDVLVNAISAGYDFSFFQLSDGSLYATGQNLAGQLGDGTMVARSEPVRVMEAVKAVAAGDSHSLILLENGTLLASGANYNFQLGATDSSGGNPVTVESGVEAIFAGGDGSCFVQSGSVKCMGSNRMGQLGLGENIVTSKMTTLGGTPSDIALGEVHTLFLQEARVEATGQNRKGQFGTGNTDSSWTPVEILKVVTTTLPTTTAPSTLPTTSPSNSSSAPTTSAQITTTTTEAQRGSSNVDDLIPGLSNDILYAILAAVVAFALTMLLLGNREASTGGEGGSELGQRLQPEP